MDAQVKKIADFLSDMYAKSKTDFVKASLSRDIRKAGIHTHARIVTSIIELNVFEIKGPNYDKQYKWNYLKYFAESTDLKEKHFIELASEIRELARKKTREYSKKIQQKIKDTKALQNKEMRTGTVSNNLFDHPFSTRTLNALKFHSDIRTLKDLSTKKTIDLMKIRNLGQRSIKEIERIMKDIDTSQIGEFNKNDGPPAKPSFSFSPVSGFTPKGKITEDILTKFKTKFPTEFGENILGSREALLKDMDMLQKTIDSVDDLILVYLR